MPIFSTTGGSGELAIDVPPFIVYVSKVVPDPDPTLPPTWANWKLEARLQVLGIFKGSSVAGMSYAKVKVATGAPLTTDSDNIESATIIGQGDRVAIGLNESTGIRWLFAGYQVQAHLNIDRRAESEIYKIMGPEWFWGSGQTAVGAHIPVYGQVRRSGPADDAFGTNTATITAFPNGTNWTIVLFSDFPTVFNPDGRHNMSITDAHLTDPADTVQIQGRPWETPDRKTNIADLSAAWTKGEAVKTLLAWWNKPAVSGIANPDFSALPMAGKALRHTNVEGLGLWHALQKVIGPEYGFYVDPVPTGISLGGSAWSVGALTFFDRADGPTASMYINPLGSSPGSAGVVRLEASKDISKVCNRVITLGKHLRHIRMLYRGGLTPTDTGIVKQQTLQHGWTQGDGNLAVYGGVDDLGKDIVDGVTIDAAGASARNTWTDKFTTKGAKFAANSHVFRLFTWNEAGEWVNAAGDGAGQKPLYGKNTTFAWFTPDLTSIADDPSFAGQFCRRRRRFLDTGYYDVKGDWQRVRPQLYITAGLTAAPGTLGPWYRVQSNHYRIDEERGALWIVHEDISQWQPFLEGINANDPNADLEAQDERTFATLLYTGLLRMMLECSVETDFAQAAIANRTSISGSPLRRTGTIRADKDFVKTDEFADGLSSPSTQTITLRDDTTALQQYADNARDAAQDQQTHASILVSADFPEQVIGTMIRQTTGRIIDLTSNGAGKGSQIIGCEMDCQTMKWQLLTETTAMHLRDVDRMEIAKHRHVHRSPQSADGPHVWNQSELPGWHAPMAPGFDPDSEKWRKGPQLPGID